MRRVFLLFLALSVSLAAQEQPPVSVEVSGQINSVTQGNFSFHSPYSGANSLPGAGEVASSRLMTLFTKMVLPASTDLEVDIESAGGSGIGNALGLAAFVNLDVVRNPALGSTPYLARAVLHHSFLRQSEQRRLDAYVGQVSTVDWFDVNATGTRFGCRQCDCTGTCRGFRNGSDAVRATPVEEAYVRPSKDKSGCGVARGNRLECGAHCARR